MKKLSCEESGKIADVYHFLKSSLNGFVEREQQKDMIRVVARALAAECPCVIQAPTGTGKSFGYQIPGMVLAHARKKRIVISTETVVLQDQIANKDIPVLLDACSQNGIGMHVAVAKGRNRFVCPLRLHEKADQASLLEEDCSEQRVFQNIADELDAGWNGLVDTLPFRVPTAIWNQVCNVREFCLKDACPYKAQCPHIAMKSELQKADIIITNHSYLLSTIAVQNGSNGKDPVTDFANNYYVIDEAHHLADCCLKSFAGHADVDDEILNESGRIAGVLDASCINEIGNHVRQIQSYGTTIRKLLDALLRDSDFRRFSYGKVPAELAGVVEDCAKEYAWLSERFQKIIDDRMTRDPSTQRASTIALFGTARMLSSSLREKADVLARFAQDSQTDAKWVDRKDGLYVIHVAPFDPAEIARRMLWNNFKGCVLTSATLAPIDDFNSVMQRLGLPDETITKKLTSPLDFSRSSMCVPKHNLDPNSEQHAIMVVYYLRLFVFEGDLRATLVYFTSRQKMEDVYGMLTEDEQEVVIMQKTGQSPAAMIAQHKQRIDAGKRSVLFGLNSLSEGIDLPGHYCTQVVIDKLPFPLPDDPILASHAEYLEQQGLNPFSVLVLPRTGEKLAQVVGRLNRHENDWGRVVILDKRLIEKRYGKQLIKATPFASIATA